MGRWRKNWRDWGFENAETQRSQRAQSVTLLNSALRSLRLCASALKKNARTLRGRPVPLGRPGEGWPAGGFPLTGNGRRFTGCRFLPTGSGGTFRESGFLSTGNGRRFKESRFLSTGNGWRFTGKRFLSTGNGWRFTGKRFLSTGNGWRFTGNHFLRTRNGVFYPPGGGFTLESRKWSLRSGGGRRGCRRRVLLADEALEVGFGDAMGFPECL